MVILIHQSRGAVKLLRFESIIVALGSCTDKLCEVLYIGVLVCRQAATVRTTLETLYPLRAGRHLCHVVSAYRIYISPLFHFNKEREFRLNSRHGSFNFQHTGILQYISPLFQRPFAISSYGYRFPWRK